MREYVNLPNLLTSGNLAAGFLSVLLIFQADFLAAAGLIALAAVFDIFDGAIARRIGSDEGMFGISLDSLADLVSFGAAPALALYIGSLHNLLVVGLIACLIFFLCGAWRLARFSAVCKNPLYFVGFPIPIAGLLTVLLATLEPHPLLALPVALSLSILMVGTLPIPTFSGLRHIKELPRAVEQDRRATD
jgi:CDP-diacylglycerol--serine O-phosphatidyltransferase